MPLPCSICLGKGTVRGPNVYDGVPCRTCGGSGKVAAEDELPTLRPPPKPPDNRPTTPVDLVECPACIDGRYPYESPLGEPCDIDCPVCIGQRIVTPEKRLAWLRKHKQ